MCNKVPEMFPFISLVTIEAEIMFNVFYIMTKSLVVSEFPACTDLFGLNIGFNWV